ncbi:Protein of unknown function [Streptococcus equinus]|uniref:DUF1642 domain-containing protein n=1 Tax=Streptococcus equinus TaxID=1335 RepID=A0A1H0Y1T3_STREI|nr:DUF1642 domain-containing protein [Streptococcus equinus]QBX24863.1 hypothetical protein Javan214_0026 [Streptococcus phage Javan214]SDQ09127.1 Protein of unknown function [Streptococcus equinus]
MNKQEVIEKLHEAGLNSDQMKYAEKYDKGYKNGIAYALNLVSKLDEPEKPVVPQFVADWIEECKTLKFELCEAMDTDVYDEKSSWIEDNSEAFAKAWIYGYEVEKEKLYTVKFSNEDFGKMYIGIFKKFNKLGISSLPLNDDEVKSWLTEDELKRFKFWENPAFEVDEVKGE